MKQIYSNFENKKKIYITHQPRLDRSGSYLQLNLYFISFCDYNNYNYLLNSNQRNSSELVNPNTLFTFFGWDKMYNKLDKKRNTVNIDYEQLLNKNNLQENTVYKLSDDTKKLESLMLKIDTFDNFFNSKFKEKLYNNFKKNNPNYPIYFDKNKTNIAIHMRRGDIGMPATGHMHAYFPNKVFINLIKKFSKEYKNPNIILFSCETNKEGWDDFKNLNCALKLRADFSHDNLKYEKIDIQHFIEADVLVIGGTFSYVPAFLNKNKVYFPETFWHSKLEHWINYKNK